jgi:RNA polymerase sigma factor (sigma-70 family)
MSDVDPGSSMDLLRRAQAGDQDALEDLLARYYPRLQRWASGRMPTGIRSMSDTADIVQETMINAIRNLKSIEIRTCGTLQAYLRRSIHNRIVDQYRRRDRRPASEELPEHAVAQDLSPLERAMGAEAIEKYERALATLKPEEQELIILRLELGFDYKEIAAETEKPSEAAARMAVTRAIRRLMEEMSAATAGK